MYILALIIAIVVYGMIAFRGLTKVPPWTSMFFGGVLMIVTGVLTVDEALQSINLDVILFLITLFIFASSLEVSGFLKYLAYMIVNKYKESRKVMFYILFYSGLLSNLVTNDGVSASWTPVILEVSKYMGVDEMPYLYSLAFGVTIGSVMMPTGNPQNLLIALEGNLREPFVIFLEYLAIPTILNLFASYYVMLILFRNRIKDIKIDDVKVDIKLNKRLAYSSLTLLIVTVILFFILSFARIDILLGSLTTSSILLLVSKERREIMSKVDWSTIIFFVGLFIFTEGLYKGGVIQLIYRVLPPPTNVLLIMISSIILSQVLSNVPLVAIYIPEMYQIGATSIVDWIALAAGSTIAGNFTLIGAASNIIISEASESRGGKSFNFFEFMKYSLPILAVNFVILYVFISLVGRV
ncbi:anion transporter [Sulfurisphaera javensis]|uniref:Anion transporter n=1 Tax=Sulfurisphaera javensis TaxID=2049879 RepID=A0AAT9GPT4_9CREN